MSLQLMHENAQRSDVSGGSLSVSVLPVRDPLH